MVLFANADIPRDSDSPCRFDFVRPAEATYDLGSAEIRLAIKVCSTQNVSIFEASTSPTAYLFLDGSTRQQTQITLTAQAADQIAGTFIIPSESTPVDYFAGQTHQGFYTLWIVADGLDLVRERGYINIVETAIAQ